MKPGPLQHADALLVLLVGQRDRVLRHRIGVEVDADDPGDVAQRGEPGPHHEARGGRRRGSSEPAPCAARPRPSPRAGRRSSCDMAGATGTSAGSDSSRATRRRRRRAVPSSCRGRTARRPCRPVPAGRAVPGPRRLAGTRLQQRDLDLPAVVGAVQRGQVGDLQRDDQRPGRGRSEVDDGELAVRATTRSPSVSRLDPAGPEGRAERQGGDGEEQQSVRHEEGKAATTAASRSAPAVRARRAARHGPRRCAAARRSRAGSGGWIVQSTWMRIELGAARHDQRCVGCCRS